MADLISRQAAIDAIEKTKTARTEDGELYVAKINAEMNINLLPSVQPAREWIPCSNPPKHHKDVIVRGIEAIGNVTVYKVMQWDVDRWRPTDYAPSIMWKEWSEI